MAYLENRLMTHLGTFGDAIISFFFLFSLYFFRAALETRCRAAPRLERIATFEYAKDCLFLDATGLIA